MGVLVVQEQASSDPSNLAQYCLRKVNSVFLDRRRMSAGPEQHQSSGTSQDGTGFEFFFVYFFRSIQDRHGCYYFVYGILVKLVVCPDCHE